MNKFFGFVSFFVINFLIYAFYISQFQFQLFNSKNSRSNFFYDYKVASNIHTNLSLGSGSVTDIVEQAQQSRQNFLIFSDLNYISANQVDRYQNQIGLLFAKKEIHDNYRLITYAFEKNTNSTHSDLKIESASLKNMYDLKHLQNTNADGLEVINLKAISQKAWERSKISTIWSLLLYPFNPRLSLMRLFGEPTEELQIFDQISRRRHISMFLGAEASARAIPVTNLIMKFPSYERVFSIGSQHLLLTSELTGNMSLDKVQIINALKKGQFYIAFDELGDPSGFETYVISGKEKKHSLMGQSIQFNSEQKIFFKLPSQPNIFFEVVLFKNGERVDHLNTYEGEFTIKSPGAYRVQVRLSPKLPLPDAIKWLTWIYTNNFYFQ
jgi:hypothetical protein